MSQLQYGHVTRNKTYLQAADCFGQGCMQIRQGNQTSSIRGTETRILFKNNYK